MCETCVHKNVCRYATEFDNLKNDIAKVTPEWALTRYVISIECKNYSKAVPVPRVVTNKNLAENYGGV